MTLQRFDVLVSRGTGSRWLVVLVLDGGAMVARIAPGAPADGDRYYWTLPVIEHGCVIERGRLTA